MNKQQLRKRKRKVRNDKTNLSFLISLGIEKPINLIGLIVIGLGLSLWASRLLFGQTAQVAKDISVSESKISSPREIAGLIDYGGAPYSEALISKGLNINLEEIYPGLKLRFVRPLNQNDNGISMLLDQELSIAYNDRPLTDSEVKKAKLRGTQLIQIPIAIDGIVFFGNNNKSVSKLSLKTAKAIFTGEINNWHEIDPKAPDLPITPILLDKESLKSIGIDLEQADAKIQYESSYTQAVREVISTPGAISFASASSVKNQFVTVFDLSDGGNNYVSPFVNGAPNIKAFRDGFYPLTRRLFVVYRQDDLTQTGKAIANYLLEEAGQKTVQDSGFVPIK